MLQWQQFEAATGYTHNENAATAGSWVFTAEGKTFTVYKNNELYGTYTGFTIVTFVAGDTFYLVSDAAADNAQYTVAAYDMLKTTRYFEASDAQYHTASPITATNSYKITAAGKTFTIYVKRTGESTFTSVGTFVSEVILAFTTGDEFYAVGDATSAGQSYAFATFAWNYYGDNELFFDAVSGGHSSITMIGTANTYMFNSKEEGDTFTVYVKGAEDSDFVNKGTFINVAILYLANNDQFYCTSTAASSGHKYVVASYNTSTVGRFLETTEAGISHAEHTNPRARDYKITATGKSFHLWVKESGESTYTDKGAFTDFAYVTLPAGCTYYLTGTTTSDVGAKYTIATYSQDAVHKFQAETGDHESFYITKTGYYSISTAPAARTTFTRIRPYSYTFTVYVQRVGESGFTSTGTYTNASTAFIKLNAGDYFYVTSTDTTVNYKILEGTAPAEDTTGKNYVGAYNFAAWGSNSNEYVAGTYTVTMFGSSTWYYRINDGEMQTVNAASADIFIDDTNGTHNIYLWSETAGATASLGYKSAVGTYKLVIANGLGSAGAMNKVFIETAGTYKIYVPAHEDATITGFCVCYYDTNSGGKNLFQATQTGGSWQGTIAAGSVVTFSVNNQTNYNNWVNAGGSATVVVEKIEA